ncbi:cell wall anchor protein [Micromonospora coxensis]|uniref:cell wall anchor protein n=1 Tax=Micromonospora coxensis TaxID=356852 RepID=UPI00343A47E6
MIFRNRPLARLGAAALLASGAFTVLGTPAYAEGGTDLSIDVAGTRVAAGTDGKLGFIKIGNKGDVIPTDVRITVDVSQLDLDKVGLSPFAERECEETKVDGRLVWDCVVPEFAVPGPGTTSELPLVVFRGTDELKGAYAAPVTFTVVTPGDTNAANNSETVKVELTDENGVDLSVWAPDINLQLVWKPGGEPEVKKPVLNPGDETVVFASVMNQGDMIADGLDFTVSLPKGVTLTEDLKGCTVAADRRSATCTAGSTRLKPGDAVYPVFPVRVAADVEAPVTLSGGTVGAGARGELPVTEKSLAKAAASELPSFLAPKVTLVEDIDPSDDSDDFAVRVVAAANGGGGGTGDGGGLPVTGPQAGLIGGVGVAVLAAGGALLMMARRRRVVLVTPGDEKPTA